MKTHHSIEFIDLAKLNSVILVTIPPHTSHKLQPLDISVYGPFKKLYNRQIDSWLVSNPAKTLEIYELAELSGRAWVKASMPANVISGFVASGLHPFQPDKWTDEDFYLTQVTDRPVPVTAPIDDSNSVGEELPNSQTSLVIQQPSIQFPADQQQDQPVVAGSPSS